MKVCLSIHETFFTAIQLNNLKPGYICRPAVERKPDACIFLASVLLWHKFCKVTEFHQPEVVTIL